MKTRDIIKEVFDGYKIVEEAHYTDEDGWDILKRKRGKNGFLETLKPKYERVARILGGTTYPWCNINKIEIFTKDKTQADIIRKLFKTAIKRVDGENMKGAKKVGKVVTANDVIGKQNKDDLVNLISGLIGLIRSRFDEVRLDCSGYLWNTRWEGGGTFTKNFSDFLDYSKLRKAVIFDFCLVGDCDENDHDDVVSVGITSYNKNGDAIATFQSDEMDERLFENPKEIKGRFLRIFINAIGGEKSAKRKEVGEN